RRSDLRVHDHPRQLRWIVNELAVERDDDVARLNAGAIRFRRLAHARHERAGRVVHSQLARELRRQFLDAYIADRAAANVAVLHQLVDDVPREVAGHRKADALIPAASAEDPRIDPDQLTAAVD